MDAEERTRLRDFIRIARADGIREDDEPLFSVGEIERVLDALDEAIASARISEAVADVEHAYREGAERERDAAEVALREHELSRESYRNLSTVAIRCAEMLSGDLGNRAALQELIYDCQNAIWFLLDRAALAATEPKEGA